MWPKALMQLIELAPHVTRLVPMADRYLQSRAQTRSVQRLAMEQLRGDVGQLAEGLHGDLSQLAAAQAGIYHQLNQQSETLARVAADMRTARLTADELDIRLTRMEKRMQQLWITLLAGMVLLVIIAAVGIAVVVTLHLHR